MTDDWTMPGQRHTEEQQAREEGAERLRRHHVWLAGLLEGRPYDVDALNKWREGMPIYIACLEESSDDDKFNSMESQVARVDVQLASLRRRIRERRDSKGIPSTQIAEEEVLARSARVMEALLADCSVGREPSPMHLVLAARYVEGEMDLLEYQQAFHAL